MEHNNSWLYLHFISTIQFQKKKRKNTYKQVLTFFSKSIKQNKYKNMKENIIYMGSRGFCIYKDDKNSPGSSSGVSCWLYAR